MEQTAAFQMKKIRPTETISMVQELARYKAQIEEWEEYKNRVEIWKEQVMQIVKQLKAQAAERNDLHAQLRNARALLQLRDEQVSRFRKYILRLGR
jgi:hypothetical protein